MTLDDQIKKGQIAITCMEEFTIVSMVDFKKQLCEIPPETNEVVVDLSGITNMDLAGIQVLCSANMMFEKSKTMLNFAGEHTELVKEILADSGYESNGGCPENPCKNCFWKGD